MGIDKMSLYRIGTGWVFDVKNDIGYRVDREKGVRRGKIKRFVKAFYIVYDEGSEAYVPKYHLKNIPVGVVRKAVHIMDLYRRGELVQRNGIYM